MELIAQWAFACAVGFAAAIAWVSWHGFAQRTSPRRMQVGDTLFASAFAIGLLTVFTQWPLKASFRLFQAELDRLIDRVERGERIAGPIQIGTFTIRSAQIRYDGYPALTLDPNPSGPTSLVRAKHFDLQGWSCLRLSENWLLYSED